MAGEREAAYKVLLDGEYCAHCHGVFHKRELFPLAMGDPPPFPEKYESTLKVYRDSDPYYLFCSGCIRHYCGSPLTNMVQMGMRRK